MFDKLKNKIEYEGEIHLPVEKLYPELNEKQLAEAKHFLIQYLEIIQRILEQEPTEK